MKRFRMPRPGTVLGVIAIVIALTGTAMAAGSLTLGAFTPDSRDRLAGTGVIQFASQAYNTGNVAAPRELKTFTVQCELAKKATSGGFKWTGQNPPGPASYEYLDSYPTGGGFTVRLYIEDGSAAENQPLSVFANCVKSRKQTGVPPV
jgi:hypothetical protein